MELQDLVRPQARYCKKLHHTCRHLLAQRLKAWMCTHFIELAHNVRDRVPDSRDSGEGARGDDPIKRLRQRSQTIGRAQVSLGAIGIVSAQRRAMCVFPKQTGDCPRIGFGHSRQTGPISAGSNHAKGSEAP